MKYGRKALDKIMTPGYKRVGLLRKRLVYSLVVYILRHNLWPIKCLYKFLPLTSPIEPENQHRILYRPIDIISDT